MCEKPRQPAFPKEWPERKLERPEPKIYPIIDSDPNGKDSDPQPKE